MVTLQSHFFKGMFTITPDGGLYLTSPDVVIDGQLDDNEPSITQRMVVLLTPILMIPVI